MNSEQAIEQLKRELSFESRTAHAYVHASGFCEYCKRELIEKRLPYASAQIDHLLPKKYYPPEITDRQENYVLSCTLCNSLKGHENVLCDGEDPTDMLANHRDELVVRASRFVEKLLPEADRKWKQAWTIISALRDGHKMA